MTTPSFLTPCLRAQAILEIQWESPDSHALSIEDLAFLNQHAADCPVCAAEIKEQKALIDTLSGLPVLPLEKSVEDRLIANVLERLDLQLDLQTDEKENQEQGKQTNPVITISRKKQWRWAIAACFIGALILAVTILQENVPSKGVIAQHEPDKANLNQMRNSSINSSINHSETRSANPSPGGTAKKGTPQFTRQNGRPVKVILVQQPQSRRDSQPQEDTSSISGELLADSTTPDEFIWGGNQSMRANAQNKEGIERIVDARQREAELAVDADQNWAEQGEASLVDFVGF